jgi:hypothetical protein
MDEGLVIKGLIGLLGILITIIGAMLKIGQTNLGKKFDKMEERIEEKLDATLCVERHDKSTDSCKQLFKHKHAPCFPDGRGGEVIIP